MRPRSDTVLPRVLAGIHASGRPMSLSEHVAFDGPLPHPGSEKLIREVARSGLRGRGGADFPTARKLEAVASRGRASAVIVNGSETEPASEKDQLLLARLPHLVLDGAVMAARAVNAAEIIVCPTAAARDACVALERAAAERDDEIPVTISPGPRGYVTGEETALIHRLHTGEPKPRFVPPRPYERGYRKAPTLVQNVETLAQLALVGRYGAEWFRGLGTEEDPGTVLSTISGSIAEAGVYELEFGTALSELVAAAGGATEQVQAFLIGGYFGTWVPASSTRGLGLSRAQLRTNGLSLGTGVVIALGQSACGLHESARVLRYLAGESSGQCGPCVHGLAALADAFEALVDGHARGGEYEKILQWCGEIRGRGACHHPDGAVRMLDSALQTFGYDLERHVRGECHERASVLSMGRRS